MVHEHHLLVVMDGSGYLLMLQPKRAEEGHGMLGGRLYQRPERLTCQKNFEHQPWRLHQLMDIGNKGRDGIAG